MDKKPEQLSRQGFAVVCKKTGDFWSSNLFETETAAKEFFDAFWRSPGFTPDQKPQWSDYRVVGAVQSLACVGEAKQ